MSDEIRNQYDPDYVSAPGETLLEVIEELGMSQADLARRTGRPKKTINEIVRTRAAITPETAIQLERVLGIPARFWNNREREYRQYLARREEEAQLRDQVEWLDEFPVKDMIKKGWIQGFDDRVQQLQEMLGFFGVASPEQRSVVWDQFPAAFRKTPAFQSSRGALAAWLRRGEIEAQDIHCQPYSAEVFDQALREARGLTVESPRVFQPTLVHLCAQAGVAVVFVPQLPGGRVSGATRWLSPSKALIQLSLRYKTDGQLWFTFFHEAGHIILHGKRDVFLEEVEGANDARGQEEEANAFAAEFLIPPRELASFLATKRTKSGYFSAQAVQAFAARLGIAPGVVVGRLQHDEHLPYSHLNHLKRRLRWAERTD